jgi:phosphate starvation-inducible PhoH-like protein
VVQVWAKLPKFTRHTLHPLAEIIFEFKEVDPLAICGINDSRINILQNHFPKVKLLARGNSVKIIGDDREVALAAEKLNQLVDYYISYGKLTDSVLEEMLGLGSADRKQEQKAPETQEQQAANDASSEVIVYGNQGLLIKARTPNQTRLVAAVDRNDMVFALGPAGTGKTYTAVALAVRALKNKQVRRIILTRPAVEAGENLGFLPGDLREKLDPYLQPLYDALRDMLPPDKLATYVESGVIQVAPLAFMRGRTLDHAFVILDEAQNATRNQMKMFLTRMGPSAKFVITGDTTQIDLPRNQPSGLIQAAGLLKGMKGVEFIYLDTSDVIRHRLVRDILMAYRDAEQNQQNDHVAERKKM